VDSSRFWTVDDGRSTFNRPQISILPFFREAERERASHQEEQGVNQHDELRAKNKLFVDEMKANNAAKPVTPPMPTQKKPFGAPLGIERPRKITIGTPWKSGTAIS
jgi:hypothetical protein